MESLNHLGLRRIGYTSGQMKKSIQSFAMWSLLIVGVFPSGCASAPEGTDPVEGIKGGSTTGQDRLWEVHSRTMRELAY